MVCDSMGVYKAIAVCVYANALVKTKTLVWTEADNGKWVRIAATTFLTACLSSSIWQMVHQASSIVSEAYQTVSA